MNRFRSVDVGFATQLESVLTIMAGQQGYLDGWAGRNLDDPGLWTLVTRWRDVGSYRRALSTYDVKVGAVPVLGTAVDEPSAYELVGGELNRAEPRELG